MPTNEIPYDKLAESADAMRAAEDEALATVRAFEAFMQTKRVGVHTFVRVESGSHECVLLDYGRYKRQTRLNILVEQYDPAKPGEDVVVARSQYLWESAPRELRAKTFRSLPALAEKIVEVAELKLALAKQAFKNAKRLTVAIRAITD